MADKRFITVLAVGGAIGLVLYLATRAKAAPLGLIGDLNDNGVVDLDDIDILGKYIAGYPISQISPLSEVEFLRRADVNGDGEINVLDITALAHLIA